MQTFPIRRILTNLFMRDLPARDRGAPSSRKSTDASDQEILSQFESLGDDCEFGYVQRRVGAEPLGLFRFASVPTQQLVNALASRFDDIGIPENIEVFEDIYTGEWLGRMQPYGFVFHTGQLTTEVSAEKAHASQAVRLRFLKRLFLEQIEAPRKIFVRHVQSGLPQNEEVLSALHSYGPCKLLSVQLANEAFEAGSVIRVSEHLYIGYISSFWKYIDGSFKSEISQWLSICKNVLRLECDPEVPCAQLPPLYDFRNFVQRATWCNPCNSETLYKSNSTTIEHSLTGDVAFPNWIIQTLHVHERLIDGRIYIFHAEVFIPADFTGIAVEILCNGLPSLQSLQLDMSQRETWQLTSVMFAGRSDLSVFLSLAVAGPKGSRVLSRSWTLREGIYTLNLI